jgi:DNA-binding transcriptional ArsR family regulator
VSQHLKVLKQAGLVTDHADGTRRIYQINPEGVQAIYSYLDQMCGPHPGYAVVTGCAREHADHEHR